MTTYKYPEPWWDGKGPPCPKCGQSRSQVRDSRCSGGRIMRVRRCVNCNTRYSTVEVSVGRRVMSKAAAAAIRHVELVGD
jgi:hypothetical protein